jgi:hypothetical protein
MAEAKLIGAWTLESFTFIDGTGQVSHPMGEDAIGYIVYSDKLMSALLSEAKRAPFAGHDRLQAEAAEKVAAYDSFLSYCGSWRIEGDRVIHSVKASSFPNFVGKDLVRVMEWEGNDLLYLNTPPLREGDQQAVARLRWRRM